MELVAARPPPQARHHPKVESPDRPVLGLGHIEDSEHATTRHFNMMTLTEITESEDSDPFIDLPVWLQIACKTIDQTEVSNTELVTTIPAVNTIKASFHAFKDAHIDPPAEKRLNKIFVNPLKNRHRQKKLYLSAEALASTPKFHQGKKALPSTYNELTRPGKVEHVCLRKVDSPPAELPAPNVEEVLDLKFSIASDVAESVSTRKRILKDQMDPYMDIYLGKVEMHPIWNKWERQARAILQEHVVYPDDATQKPYNGQLHKAYNLSNLDYFDGAPFLPMTPSTASRSSAPSKRSEYEQPITPSGSTFAMPNNGERGHLAMNPHGFANQGILSSESHFDGRENSYQDGLPHMSRSPPSSRSFHRQLSFEAFRPSCDTYDQGRRQQESSSHSNFPHNDRSSVPDKQYSVDRNYRSQGPIPHTVSSFSSSPLRSDTELWNQTTVSPAEVFPGYHDETKFEHTSASAEWQTSSSISDAAHGHSSHKQDAAETTVQPQQQKSEPLFFPVSQSDHIDEDLFGPIAAQPVVQTSRAPAVKDSAHAVRKTSTSKSPRWVTWQEVEEAERERAEEVKRKDEGRQERFSEEPEEIDELDPEEYATPLKYWPTYPYNFNRTDGAYHKIDLKGVSGPTDFETEEQAKRPTKKAKQKKMGEDMSLEDLIKTLDPKTIGKKAPGANNKKGLSSSTHSSTGKAVQANPPAAVADPHTLDGHLILRGRSDLVDQDKPASQPCDLPPVEEEEIEDWRSNKDIQNPKWYLESSSATFAPHDPPFPILIASTVLQNIALMRATREEGFDLVERENKMEETDIVLSATTAVLIHDFSELGHTHDKLFQDLKAAAGFYKRVILVFEMQPFLAADHNYRHSVGEKIASSPLSSDAMRGLKTLKKAYGFAFKSTKSIIGDIEIIYACNGAAEVARALSHVVREEGEQAGPCMEERHWNEMWGARDWLVREQPEDWQIGDLIAHFGLNTFCAVYAHYRSEGNIEYIEELSDGERRDEFEAVFGRIIMDRFNQRIKEKKEWSRTAKRMLPGGP
ncbi:hypothetical protein IAT40_003920 [Kwoniella sp. CBS 6097]